MAYKSARVVDSKKTDDRSAGGRPHSGGQLPATPAVPEDAANETLSKLSHDIRTQLYIIIGFAELMLEEVPGKINDEQRRNLNDVLTSGKRLQDLLNDIVTRSKGAQNRKGL
jgi:signal transduction histidine kinase